MGLNSLDPYCEGMNRHFQFKSTRKMLKSSYYRNFCTDSNRIMQNDKDHQVLFLCGPNVRQMNPRWRTPAILQTMINRYVGDGWTDR